MRRDDPEVFQVKGLEELFGELGSEKIAELTEILRPHVTEKRFAKMQNAVQNRTHQVVPVLEGLTDPHNISAILRSADAFGIQNVHVIEGPAGFGASRGVTRGAHKWIDVIKHPSAKKCAEHLHEQGYKIFVAAMDGALKPEDLKETEKVALVFGNEHAGVSPDFRETADGTYAIPMVGFVESLNVSVAAAITLYNATRRAAATIGQEEQNQLLVRYLIRSIKNVGILLEKNGFKISHT